MGPPAKPDLRRRNPNKKRVVYLFRRGSNRICEKKDVKATFDSKPYRRPDTQTSETRKRLSDPSVPLLRVPRRRMVRDLETAFVQTNIHLSVDAFGRPIGLKTKDTRITYDLSWSENTMRRALRGTHARAQFELPRSTRCGCAARPASVALTSPCYCPSCRRPRRCRRT